MLILWYLFCFKNAQVPCTAPSSEQMYDVLWKEIAVWLRRMPQGVQDLYEWSASYIRMVEAPETWFARAKTARKEAPEALAGVHGEFVFMTVDEASGVAEEIFNTAEGALTNENILILMISNPTRLIGYFYDAFHRFKALWQTMQFDGRDSPIVDMQMVESVIARHGEDSDEFKIRVTGQFADVDAVDAQGYVPLLTQDDIKEIPDIGKFRPGWARMGVDPAGLGKNKTEWVVRDRFRAKIVASEDKSDGASIAQKTIALMDLFGIPDWQVTIDSFGEGTDAIQELALAGYRVYGLNTGHPCDDPADRAQYINIRAMISWRARQWIKKSELIRNKKWKQLLQIRYRRQLSGKIKVMDKEEMRKQGIQSPDAWDALSLTFSRPDNYEVRMNDDLSDGEVNSALGVYEH
jgi:phage terminase large subunit